MSVWVKSWLLLGAIFAVGIVTGSALTVGLGPHFAQPMEVHHFKKDLMLHLTHRLALTPDQQQKIEPIVTDAVGRVQAMHHDEVARESEVFKSAFEQISGFLTPDQKTKLEKMESDREKMFSEHMRAGGGGHEDRPHGRPEDLPPPPSS